MTNVMMLDVQQNVTDHAPPSLDPQAPQLPMIAG